MLTPNDDYIQRLSSAVRSSLLRGARSLEEVLAAVGGADPLLVAQIKADIVNESGHSEELKSRAAGAAMARRETAALALLMPAADPLRSQWWFTLDTAVDLSNKARELAGDDMVAFLGTPTAAFHFSVAHQNGLLLLDADHDVIRCMDFSGRAVARVYDVYSPLQPSDRGGYAVVVIDPPWYPDKTSAFLARGRELLKAEGGYLIVVLPSLYTRPDLITERTSLIADLLAAGYQFLALTERVVRYYVPGFEEVVYRRVQEFTGRSWRSGDLLIVYAPSNTAPLPIRGKADPHTMRFTRRHSVLRVFLRPDLQEHAAERWITPIAEFEESVSTRAYDVTSIALWTTEQKAARVKDASLVQAVLNAWQEGHEPSVAVEALTSTGLETSAAEAIVAECEEALGLWASSQTAKKRHGAAVLEKQREAALSDLAAKPTKREHEFKSDGYRLGFQRDRDRVLWSHSLKRLANKTQVFALGSDEHVRRRLSHSIEVMQLASTIATAFALDRDLTEAGALAHDLGHAPFGHAGEHAIDVVLREVTNNKLGFNHYEHGVDTVRWLENVYRSPGAGGFPGLNLTVETLEIILKHTYTRRGDGSSQEQILAASKHRDLINDDGCHLEGQAVRIADKVSYLISDLEDAIRMNVLQLNDIKACRLFDRPSVDLVPQAGESLYARFISQRRSILQILMEDILNETDRQLASHTSLASVRAEQRYVVAHSSMVQAEVDEVWQKLQAGKLHRDGRVEAANRRAAEIVSTLLLLFAVRPSSVDSEYRTFHASLVGSDYMNHYDKLLGDKVQIDERLIGRFFLNRTIGAARNLTDGVYLVDTKALICAKDFVASLSDQRAMTMFADLFGAGVTG